MPAIAIAEVIIIHQGNDEEGMVSLAPNSTYDAQKCGDASVKLCVLR